MRQEIQVFGTSFLDLLSGALAAVIILFVIVPKMSVDQQQTLEQIEQMNVQVQELEQLMEQVRNSVPEEVYQQIQQQLEALQQTIDELSGQVHNLQQRLAEVEAENRQLRQQVEQLQELQQQNQQQAQRIAELERELAQRPPQQPQQQQGNGISDGKVFGMNAELGVVCQWKEDIDVDLYVKDLNTGTVCFYGNKNTPFGDLNEDITTRHGDNDDRYELFYQTEIIPGRYEVSVNIYQRADTHGQAAHVEGYVVLHPGKSNQIKIPYSGITLTVPGQHQTVGTLTVSENSITLN